MIGPSRKSFIGYYTDKEVDDRIFGTAASVAYGIINGANMTKMIKSLLLFSLVSGALYAQSLQGNVNCVGAIVEYTYVARAIESPEDSANGVGYQVTGSWPSSAAAAAGMGYTRVLASFEIGDTITTALVPLVSPETLALPFEPQAARPPPIHLRLQLPELLLEHFILLPQVVQSPRAASRGEHSHRFHSQSGEDSMGLDATSHGFRGPGNRGT